MAGKRWMLVRMIVASLVRRKSRVAIAFAAIVIGAAISSGLASVYYDVGQKMSQELRAYGANLVVVPASPEQQPYVKLSDISSIASSITDGKLVGYVPYLYGVASLQSQDVVIAGTHFDRMLKVFPSWKINGVSTVNDKKGSAIVGEVVATSLGIAPGSRIELYSTTTSKTVELQVEGVLSTGSSEDNHVFIDLDAAGELLNKPGVVSVAYFSVLGNLQELDLFSNSIQQEFDGVSAKPIKQVSQSEGGVLEKIKSLVFLAVAVILLLTMLCVGITMLNTAMERRREIGLRKALGAQSRDIMFEFLAEGVFLGFAGGVVGWALGLLFAQAVGQSVFQSPVSFRPEILPFAVVLTVTLVALASFIPARAAASVQPATTLRGE
ncbi:MAG: FtsX-like permease family protein [Dehalococcoidales bacterium]|nr:FtsX-like permease family protein [Dehalococcoidales bacterium]